MEHIGTRLHGKTWEYYFEGPRVNGIRKKIFKSGFLTKEQAIEAGLQKLNEYTVFYLNRLISYLSSFWILGLKMI